MSIRAILTVYTAARDRNGNCYHSAEYTDTASGATVRFRDIGGSGNMDNLPALMGLTLPGYTSLIDWDQVRMDRQTLPIREYNRLTKDWPYVANHANDKAVAAVCAAIAAAEVIP